MCTFLSTLPKKSKTAGTASKPRNLALYMRPCPDTDGELTWYRFRLLNFASKTSNRDFPFIQRYVHQKLHKNDKGFNEVESEVVCPVTKWVEWAGDRYNCPICKFANQQYNTLKETNWKDADARQKNKEFSRKFQAIIPVYVVSDPNYDGNNGKMRVLIFNDKKFYDEFMKKLEKQLLKGNCFNGVNAMDCCMHMGVEDVLCNEGKSNQFVWHKRVIDKICFSKPYDLPAITKESVDAFPFDDTYYVSSTSDEIDAFYKKYIKVSNDDIVIDDEDVVEATVEAPKSELSATAADIEVILDDDDKSTMNDDISDDELDSLLDDVPSKNEVTAEKPAAKAEEIVPAGAVKDNSIADDDIDSLLKDIDI